MIEAHRKRVAGHIGGEDRGEAAGGGHWDPALDLSAEINPKTPAPHSFFKVEPFAVARCFAAN